MTHTLPILTPLALLALALLVEKPMHAYEMLQTMEQRRFDWMVKLRAGSLYHTVDRLVRDGLAEVVGTDREGNRPERTTYRVTDTGREALDGALIGMLSTPPTEYPEFSVALSEAHNLPAEQTVDLLELRLAALRARAARYSQAAEHLTELRLPRAYWIESEYAHHMLLADIAWIERLVADLRSGELDWAPEFHGPKADAP